MLDHRLNEPVHNAKNGRIRESAVDAKQLQSKLPPPQLQPNPVSSQKRKLSFLQWFYDLPINRKQLIVAGTSLTSIAGIVTVGGLLNLKGIQNQLRYQAQSEVAVTTINYNIKVNQMGFGFRGQADNAAIIAAAKAQTLNPALQNQVKQILQNEITARKIEYATLVGKDLRIIVNANAERQGEIFNPNNLVKEVFSDPRQIKASAIVRWSELAKESPPLPSNFARQDALIRYTVTPVRDPATKTTIGALVSGDIVNGKLPIVQGTLKAFGDGYSAVYLRKPTGEFVLATSLDQGEAENLDAAKANVALPKTSLLAAAADANGKPVTGRIELSGINYTIAAQALPNIFKEEASGPVPVPSGEPVAILVRGTSEVEINGLILSSLWVQTLLGLLALAANVGLAIVIGRAITKPVKDLQRTAQDFSTGDQTRAEVFADDEIGQLAVTFNKMADSIDTSLVAQRQEAERAQLLKDVTLRISQSLNSVEILNKAVQEIRLALKTDRVVVYTFNEKWQGTVAFESVSDGFPRALGAKIADPCFADRYVEKYRSGRVQATNNIYEAGLTVCHMKQLEPFAVKASLVAPILQNNQLLGLLIAHQCSAPRAWQKTEIDLFSQLAIQVGLALDRANVLEEQKVTKELLQRRALELLVQVDPVSRGDLTIRANVTDDEIGTIADSYNATIASLRRIVNQVQAAAKQMASTTSSSEASVQGLSQEALRQTDEITAALDRIGEMSKSIRAVGMSAEQAEAAVKEANQTVEAGDAAMNRTVEGFLAIRETVAQTSKKVKRLGESSQKISKVVNLIGTFAEQTNLLALNAAIEAANAGEQGRGFAVVAERVRALARQSAQATAEIESLVTDIQTETNEVVAAMEAGTEQVVTGTKLVDETRQSLNKITAVSGQIGILVEAIASAAVTQTQASESVTKTISDVAAISSKTSNEASSVSASFKELLAVANELQASAGQFKVS